MDITFTEDWRQFSEGWSGRLPAPIANNALAEDVAEHTSVLKRELGYHPRKGPDREPETETATRQPPENAAERTSRPQPRHTGGGWWEVPGHDSKVRAPADAEPEDVLEKAEE